MRKKIVLAHGLLGFASLGGGLVTYFNRVRAQYEAQNCEVLPPVVAAVGSLDRRATELARAIHAAWGQTDDPIYMIGHSMGGLDCRRVIATDDAIGRRVRRLITVCTPHLGSPVADAVDDAANPLYDAIPDSLRAVLRAEAGAIDDLRTRSKPHNVDRPDVDYVCIGADATHLLPPSPFSVLAAKIHKLSGEINDGVVTAASAAGKRQLVTPLWSVDHGGAIGWPTDPLGLAAAVISPPSAHVARYQQLLTMLTA